MTRVNADLVGKVVNIASRTAKFIDKYFNNMLSQQVADPELLLTLQEAKQAIIDDYHARNFAKATRTIMALADQVNQYIDANKPWQLIKTEGHEDNVHQVCSLGLECFRIIIIYLKPILPELAAAVEQFLKVTPQTWDDIEQPILGKAISKFEPLLNRVQQTDIDALANSRGK